MQVARLEVRYGESSKSLPNRPADTAQITKTRASIVMKAYVQV